MDSPESLALAALAVPTNTAIQAFRDAVSALSAPFQIRRLAAAEASAQMLEAKGDIETEALRQRARHSRELEEIRHQHNKEQITAGAEAFLPAALPERRPDPDWIFHFFEEARNTSDQEMQRLWSKLLAGEFSGPGTFSRRTVSTVKLLDSADAKAFSAFCKVVDDAGHAILVKGDDFVVEALGLSFSVLDHLDAIGLIRLNPLGTFSLIQPFEPDEEAFPQYVPFTLGYPIAEVKVDLPVLDASDEARLELGQAVLTHQGRELSTLVDRAPQLGLSEYLQRAVSELNPGAIVSVSSRDNQ